MSGDYIFRGSADDNFAVYLSDEYGSATVNPDPIIYDTSNIPERYSDNLLIYNRSQTLGDPITFSAGRYYYMEVYHVNTGGVGYLKISVEVPNSDVSLNWQRYEVNQI